LKRWIMACAALCMAACDQEAPTEVGGRLLPADAIRTFEVILEPDRYLAFDTAFGLYSLPAETDFAIIANSYGGSVNARILAQYTLPRSIVVIDSLGVLRTDSTPRFFSADIQLILDSVATTLPASLEVYRTTESWDRVSATWTHRVDTAGARIPWRTAGGSPGLIVSTTNVVAGTDTVRLPVDSATLIAWSDTTNAARGALITSATANTRLRTTLPVLRVRARSSIRTPRDTVVETLVSPSRTWIFTPEQPDSTSAPRVGGTPAWRTIMRLKERLDTVTVPCPGEPNCRLQIGSAAVSFAALQLQPVPAPPGFEPELPLDMLANAVLPQTQVPLQRSPITDPVGGLVATIPSSRFVTPNAPIVELIMTEFLAAAFNPPFEGEALRPSHFALLQSGSTRTFGFGTFAQRPRLRLVLTTARRLELP
jgi:hypothetical protein